VDVLRERKRAGRLPALVPNDVGVASGLVSARRRASREQMRDAVRKRAGHELVTFDRR